MAPVRVGLLGLNASSSWAVYAHLPYLLNSPKFTITALCNSSVENAKAAIKAHSLPDTVKAYGSPEDLAKDPNVDLVVCSVRVDRHYETLLPSVKAGKDIFCEWLLGKDLAEAEELTRIAKEKGSKTMVGLQAVRSPIITKVKDLIGQGKIGKVMSTSFVGTAKNGGHQESAHLEYTTYKEIGGNVLTIHFGHSVDAIIFALGELASFNSILDTTLKTIEITDKDPSDPSRKVIKTVARTAPDQILLQGHLASGALFSYHLRGGQHFDKTDGFTWRIYGEKGEIHVTGPAATIQVSDPNYKIRFSPLDGSEPQDMTVEDDEWNKLILPAQNVARLYESFVDGKREEYLDWEDAVRRHRLIDEMYSRQAKGQQDIAATYTQN